MAVSTYFINRDPNRFGGQQDDYKAQVKKIVTQGTQKVQTAISNCSDLKKVFFSMQTSLEKDRGRIAKEHKTSFADRIALRRNTEEAVKNGETAAYTHLEETYKDYGNKMLGDLIKRLETMTHDNTGFSERKVSSIEPEYLGISTQFEIELIPLADLEKLKWLDPVDWSKSEKALKYATNRSLPLMEKLKGMAKVTPELWQQDKMRSYISILGQFHPKHPITHLVLASKRQKINGVLVPISQYLTWMSCDGKEDPLVRMKNESRIMVLHQDVTLLDDSLNDIAALFEKAINWAPANGVKDLKDRVGLFRSAYAEAMPHHRGSGAIAEWFENIIYSFHGYDLAYAEDKSLDLESLTSFSLAEFMKVYHEAVTLTKRV